MQLCQIAETDGELMYVQGTDIEASSSDVKLASIFNNCNAQGYYEYYFKNAYSIYTSMQSEF